MPTGRKLAIVLVVLAAMMIVADLVAALCFALAHKPFVVLLACLAPAFSMLPIAILAWLGRLSPRRG
jgi:hypothetical protein